MRPCLLSLCITVKDEEKRLNACLQSVHGLAGEIITVDTGSKDRTREIARRHGARVLPMEWSGNFAAARNRGLKEARGKWVLWLDADERLQTADPARLLRLLRESDAPLFAVRMKHLVGETADKHRAFCSDSHRVFRNGLGIRFTGAVHEHLQLPEALALPVPIPRLPAWILHEGYLDAAVAEKQKSARNLALLQAQRGTPDYTPWTDYHIAVELTRQKRGAEAFACVNNAIRGFLALGQLPPAVLYHLKYTIALDEGCGAQTLAGLEKAIVLYPGDVDLRFFKGALLLARGEYARAAAAFRFCLVLGESTDGGLHYSGYGSYHALYNLGLCLEHLGQTDAAANAYGQALTLWPGYAQARGALRRLHETPGNGRTV